MREDGHFVLEAGVAGGTRSAGHGDAEWERERNSVDALGCGVGDCVCVTIVSIVIFQAARQVHWLICNESVVCLYHLRIVVVVIDFASVLGQELACKTIHPNRALCHICGARRFEGLCDANERL